MAMSEAPAVRRASVADSRTCFALFRRSLRDLLRRVGYVPATDPDPDLEGVWPAYADVFDHLGATHAEWWLAEDSEGDPVGYARSIQRGPMVELTEFFVAPDARIAGVGRALLERAFAPRLGTHRSVIATLDAPAVALYLRFGVAHQTTGVDISGRPRAVDFPAGYDVAPATLEGVLEIERDVLAHARAEDMSFILADRAGSVISRSGRPVAYAFSPNGHGYAGPVAARDPAHLPAALAYLEREAHSAGTERLDLTVPLASETAIEWLVGERGFRIDPFYCLYLADGPWARLDRYLPFNPCMFL
jgi:GNAT superfamily N-acetyltransferase